MYLVSVNHRAILKLVDIHSMTKRSLRWEPFETLSPKLSISTRDFLATTHKLGHNPRCDFHSPKQQRKISSLTAWYKHTRRRRHSLTSTTSAQRPPRQPPALASSKYTTMKVFGTPWFLGGIGNMELLDGERNADWGGGYSLDRTRLLLRCEDLPFQGTTTSIPDRPFHRCCLSHALLHYIYQRGYGMEGLRERFANEGVFLLEH